MSSYVPPSASGISFDFTAAGYEAPSASGLKFRFGLRPSYSDVANMGASIYGIAVSGSENISAFVRPTIQSQSDLASYLQTIQPIDLPAFIRPLQPSYKNLGAAIRRIDREETANLGGYLSALSIIDLPAIIGAHPPADLGGAIKAWYRENTKDLGAFITGEFIKGTTDLGAVIGMHPPANLNAYLSGWAPVDLPAYINTVYKFDLPAFIQSTSTKNLNAVLRAIAPVNLPASIHGFDERFLSADINGVYGPYDLQAYLRVHPYLNLPAAIHGWYSGTWDLRAYISGSYSGTEDLGATINARGEFRDLGAVVTARGEFRDLGAYIIPNVVRLKQAIQVSLLEHKNMKAMINFQCVSSAYANLGVTFGTIFKKLDMPAFIWGWYSADGYGELKAYINTALYSVEDKFDIRFVPNIRSYTQLRIKFGVTDIYTVFDTLPVLYGSYYTKSLGAYIQAIPRAVDLGASIEPVLQTNYSELPDYINPKSNVVVLKFKDKDSWHEQWRRFVEIMFKKDGPAPYNYFYVSGTSRVYKIDRSRHWTIWATSYDKDETTMFDRANVRTKFIFNMSNYTKIDEALRDLIDRVSVYRESDMFASINCIDNIHADLEVYINPVGMRRRKWADYLGASINGIP